MKKIKKIVIFITILSLFTSILMPTAYAATNKIVYLDSSKVIDSKNPIKLIAHRGFSGIAPENTLAAIRLAGEYGFYGCEFDIRATSDGQWIVIHDDDVDRMTDGTGSISEKTYSEIKELSIDYGNNINEYPNEKVPTLQQALDVCYKYGIHPIIEIKSGSNDYLENLKNILIGYADFDNITIISVGSNCLKEVRRLLPTTEIWIVANKIDDSLIDLCITNKIDGITFCTSYNDGQTVALAKNANLVTSAWTVDSLKKAEEMYSYDVEYLTTNIIAPKNTHGFFERIVDFFKKIIEWFNSLFN